MDIDESSASEKDEASQKTGMEESQSGSDLDTTTKTSFLKHLKPFKDDNNNNNKNNNNTKNKKGKKGEEV